MKRILFATVMIVAFAGLASAQVAGTAHDLGSGGSSTFRATDVDEVCVFCHTPHQPTGVDQDPLWNHTLASSSPNYGVYASDTLNASVTDFNGQSGNVSSLCMSCHDGTVGVGSLYNDPNRQGQPDNNATVIIGAALVGTDLTNDHPVNFDYDSALATEDGGLVTPTSTAFVDAGGSVPLFNGTVQCASCHDPHDDTNDPFLVVSNVGSNLCTQCHNK